MKKPQSRHIVWLILILFFAYALTKMFLIPYFHYGEIHFIKRIDFKHYEPDHEEQQQIVYISERPQAFFFPIDHIWFGSIIIDDKNYPVAAELTYPDETFGVYDFYSSVEWENGEPKMASQTPFLFSGLFGYIKDGVEFIVENKWDLLTEAGYGKKIVFKKYQKSDVNLEEMGFDLSFLNVPD